MRSLVDAWIESNLLQKDHLLVIGCSTSEVAGKQIGSSGSESIAEVIFDELQELAKRTNAYLVFQCCEHLNRALVIEREAQQRYSLTEVSVLPTPRAGGALAAYAYNHMKEPVIVEAVQADAGIDIGQTMIGMHLKPVAVPLRISQKSIHQAIITCAKTRPKLIGGNRASYK